VAERIFRIPDFNRGSGRGTGSKCEYTTFSRKKRQRPVCWPMASGLPSRRPQPSRSPTKTSRWCVGWCEVSDVTRSSVTLSWLAPTSNDGAAIMAYVVERPEHLLPTWTRVAQVKAADDRLHGRQPPGNVEGPDRR